MMAIDKTTAYLFLTLLIGLTTLVGLLMFSIGLKRAKVHAERLIHPMNEVEEIGEEKRK